MLGRDWLRYVSAITLLVAAVLFVGQTGLAVWQQYELSRNAYRQYQNATKSEQDKAADDIAANCSVVAQVNPALRNCLREAVQAYQKKNNTNQDLEAQKDMAYWAFVTALVSAAGLLISIGGLYMLFQSLRQTRQAITNDRQIGEAQVRAYLAIDPITQATKIDSKVRSFKATLVIKNTGQSPAYNVRQISKMFMEKYPLPRDQGDLFVPDPSSVERGSTLPAGGTLNVPVDLDEPLTEAQFKSAMNNGDDRLYMASIVFYDSVFKERLSNKTKFCAYWEKSETLADGKASRYSWMLANVHNDAT